MALEVNDLRRRAFGKFTLSEEMWFTRQGLEQATPELVALHKATRFRDAAGDDPVWDLCCGIGGDALPLTMVRDVIAVDADSAQTLRTELNVRLYHATSDAEQRRRPARSNSATSEAHLPGKDSPSPTVSCGRHHLRTRVADVTTLPLDGQLVHIDPDRRAHGQRVLRLEQYVPPLDWLQELTRRARGGAIKVSPASNFGGKFPDAEIELISLDGECKEATIWFGELRSDAPWRATVLPKGETLAGHPLDAYTDVRPLGRYLYDPDPAVVRAGLVDLLAQQTGLWRLDAAEEFLSSDELVETPFCAPFEVLEDVPNNPKLLRAAVRGHDWGQVEIKCRHVRTDADAVRRKLPLNGSGSGVVVFARLDGKTRVLLARRS
ncbi:MAG: hypothetical protein KDA75_03505 [Planctomycetaceae bacterium]|nr:hypothetical protein [Planctomycetaceae bacterium]